MKKVIILAAFLSLGALAARAQSAPPTGDAERYFTPKEREIRRNAANPSTLDAALSLVTAPAEWVSELVHSWLNDKVANQPAAPVTEPTPQYGRYNQMTTMIGKD